MAVPSNRLTASNRFFLKSPKSFGQPHRLLSRQVAEGLDGVISSRRRGLLMHNGQLPSLAVCECTSFWTGRSRTVIAHPVIVLEPHKGDDMAKPVQTAVELARHKRGTMFGL